MAENPPTGYYTKYNRDVDLCVSFRPESILMLWVLSIEGEKIIAL